MKAIDIINDGFERCNRLSPGETLSNDDAALGFRRLNLLVDELSGKNLFLFRNVLTSNAQSGHITLGSGAWASIPVGKEIVSATADNIPLDPITMQQFNQLYQPAVHGIPSVWAQDGQGTVYLWPVANGQTIKLQTRNTVSAFADQNTTDYSMPPGYQDLLGAMLAVRLAPNVLGSVPPYLNYAEKAAKSVIGSYEPAIIDVFSFNDNRQYYPPKLF